jgi:hypothetical protein
MGGFLRKLFGKPKVKQQLQAIKTSPATQQVEKSTRRVSKPYVDDTIMTSAAGLEDEANVKKAELGGTILKKKKKYA